MRVTHWIAAALLAAVAACGEASHVPRGPDADALRELTQAELRLEFDALLPPVLEALGLPPSTQLAVRLSDADEIAEVLAAELAHSMRNASMPDADVTARASASAVSRALVAKYDVRDEVVLVSPATLLRVAGQLREPELARPDVLRAVLLHEAVHAASQARYGWAEHFERLPAGPRTSAFGALLEGHAQFVGRRLARRAGLSEAFEEFTHAIGAEPPGMEAGERQIAMFVVADLLAQYVDGEAFVAALVEAEGDDVFERLYREPPQEMGAVRRPEWYLDPALRPQATHDFEPALDVFESVLGDGWVSVRITASPAQLDAAFALMPRPEAARILSGLMANRMLTASREDAPGEAMIVAGLYEFVDAAAAARYDAGARELSRLKDAAFRGGSLDISSSERRELAADGALGYVERKQLDYHGEDVVVVSLGLTRGALGVEILYSNEPVSDELIDKLGFALLEEFEASRLEEALPDD